MVADRLVADCEFEDPVEDESSAARGAPVEAEHELVEVALQVSFVDRSLVGAEQPAFRERRYPMHTGEQFGGVITTCLCCPLTAPVVDVAE